MDHYNIVNGSLSRAVALSKISKHSLFMLNPWSGVFEGAVPSAQPLDLGVCTGIGWGHCAERAVDEKGYRGGTLHLSAGRSGHVLP